MNTTFSWNRFCKVLQKDGRGLWQHFGLTMLIITLIPFAFWLIKFVISPQTGSIDSGFRIRLLYLLPYLVMILAPSRLYPTCNIPKEGVYFAMLPASHLEKYLSMMVYCIIVCPLLSFVSLWFIDTLLAVLPFGPYKYILNPLDLPTFNNTLFADGDTDWLIDNVNTPLLRIAGGINEIMGFVICGQIFLFTTTIFKKHKVLGTILWMMLIGFVLSLILIPISVYVVKLNLKNIMYFFEYYEPDVKLLIHYLVCGFALFHIAVSALLFWWTGRRLRKMRY